MAPEIWYLCPTLFTDNIAREQALFCLTYLWCFAWFHIHCFCMSVTIYMQLGSRWPDMQNHCLWNHHNITCKAGIFLYKIKQVRKTKNVGYQSIDNICITQLWIHSLLSTLLGEMRARRLAKNAKTIWWNHPKNQEKYEKYLQNEWCKHFQKP